MNGFIALSASEAIAYLYRNTDCSARERETVESIVRRVNDAADPQYATRRYRLQRTQSALYLSGTRIELQGNSIRTHLKQCDEVVLMAATIGGQADRLIEQLKLTDVTGAYLADVCGSLLIEKVCDALSQDVRAQADAEGKGITSRFSCGYGDFPLTMQSDFLTLTGADKRLGLRLSDGGMMVPTKSVTAVIGLGAGAIEKSGRCLSCPKKGQCKESLCGD